MYSYYANQAAPMPPPYGGGGGGGGYPFNALQAPVGVGGNNMMIMPHHGTGFAENYLGVKPKSARPRSAPRQQQQQQPVVMVQPQPMMVMPAAANTTTTNTLMYKQIQKKRKKKQQKHQKHQKHIVYPQQSGAAMYMVPAAANPVLVQQQPHQQHNDKKHKHKQHLSDLAKQYASWTMFNKSNHDDDKEVKEEKFEKFTDMMKPYHKDLFRFCSENNKLNSLNNANSIYEVTLRILKNMMKKTAKQEKKKGEEAENVKPLIVEHMSQLNLFIPAFIQMKLNVPKKKKVKRNKRKPVYQKVFDAEKKQEVYDFIKELVVDKHLFMGKRGSITEEKLKTALNKDAPWSENADKAFRTILRHHNYKSLASAKPHVGGEPSHHSNIMPEEKSEDIPHDGMMKMRSKFASSSSANAARRHSGSSCNSDDNHDGLRSNLRGYDEAHPASLAVPMGRF